MEIMITVMAMIMHTTTEQDIHIHMEMDMYTSIQRLQVFKTKGLKRVLSMSLIIMNTTMNMELGTITSMNIITSIMNMTMPMKRRMARRKQRISM